MDENIASHENLTVRNHYRRIFCVPECRHPTSYAELDGIQVKISEKYRFSETSFMQQVNCQYNYHCISMTMRMSMSM